MYLGPVDADTWNRMTDDDFANSDAEITEKGRKKRAVLDDLIDAKTAKIRAIEIHAARIPCPFQVEPRR